MIFFVFLLSIIAIKRDERDFLNWRLLPRITISPSLFENSFPPIPECVVHAREEPVPEAPHWFPLDPGSTLPTDIPFPTLPTPNPGALEPTFDNFDNFFNQVFDQFLVPLFSNVSRHPEEPSRNARLEKVVQEVTHIKNNQRKQQRMLNNAEEEIPSLRPTYNPMTDDFSYIETLIESLSSSRSLYHNFYCLIESQVSNVGQPLPILFWRITGRKQASLGHCMCSGIDYGAIFNDKFWGTCRWMDVFHKHYLCSDYKSIDVLCNPGLLDPAFTAPPVDTDVNGEEVPQDLFLKSFADVAEEDLIPRDLKLENLQEELPTYYYLFRNLEIAHQFSKEYLCGQQDPITKELVPGWEIIKHVLIDEIGDLVVESSGMGGIPIALVSQRDCDLLITIRAIITDYEAKVFLRNNQLSLNVTSSKYGGYHAGFFSVGSDIFNAIETDIEDQMACATDATRRLIISGHGIGGGIAQPLAHIISIETENNPNKPEISAVLFGAPQAMNSQHIDDYNSRINTRLIDTDTDVFPALPCREINANRGNPVCAGYAAVPNSQKDGRWAYYGRVNGRLPTIDHITDILIRAPLDPNWDNNLMLDVNVVLATRTINAEGFNNIPFQYKANHHCSYACWTSQFLTQPALWWCADCPFWVRRSGSRTI